MKLKSFRLLFLAFIFQFAGMAQTINSEKSKVDFEIPTVGIFSVDGTISGFSGQIKFDPDQLDQAKIHVCIDATSLETGNGKRDEKVKSDLFMDVKQYPDICFTSTVVKKTSGGFLTKGKLKLHGVSKTVEIPLEYKNNFLKGTLKINRLDYNVGKGVGTIKAGKIIEIKINCVLKS